MIGPGLKLSIGVVAMMLNEEVTELSIQDVLHAAIDSYGPSGAVDAIAGIGLLVLSGVLEPTEDGRLLRGPNFNEACAQPAVALTLASHAKRCASEKEEQ